MNYQVFVQREILIESIPGPLPVVVQESFPDVLVQQKSLQPLVVSSSLQEVNVSDMFSPWNLAEPFVSQDLERGHEGVGCESVKGGFCSHIFFVTFDYSPTHPSQGNKQRSRVSR